MHVVPPFQKQLNMDGFLNKYFSADSSPLQMQSSFPFSLLPPPSVPTASNRQSKEPSDDPTSLHSSSSLALTSKLTKIQPINDISASNYKDLPNILASSEYCLFASDLKRILGGLRGQENVYQENAYRAPGHPTLSSSSSSSSSSKEPFYREPASRESSREVSFKKPSSSVKEPSYKEHSSSSRPPGLFKKHPIPTFSGICSSSKDIIDLTGDSETDKSETDISETDIDEDKKVSQRV